MSSIIDRGLARFRPDTDAPSDELALIERDLDGKRRRIPIIEFGIPNGVERTLSKEQIQLLNELQRVARRLGDLYLIQEELSFWPDEVKESEIEEASKENPDIKSPYTYVSREEDGTLVAIPIHEVFKDVIKDKQIVASLKRAADLSGKGRERDLDLQAYLRARARAFETGNWEYSESLWLQMPKLPKIFIIVGPYDNYLDPRKRKYAWESWVGVLDEKETRKAEDIAEKICTWFEQDNGQPAPKVGVRVDHTVVMSGQAAKYEWIGNSLPCQMELRNQFGSVFTIFESVFKDKLRTKWLPVYRSAIEPRRRFGVTDEMVERVRLNLSIAHEIGHSIVAEDISQRLGRHSGWVKELFCDLWALRACFATLESNREKELAFALTFVNGIVEYATYALDKNREEYYLSNSTLLSFPIREGSIEVNRVRLAWNDAKEVMDDILELYTIVDYVQAQGTATHAYELSQNHLDPEVYGRLVEEVKPPAFMLKRPSKNR